MAIKMLQQEAIKKIEEKNGLPFNKNVSVNKSKDREKGERGRNDKECIKGTQT